MRQRLITLIAVTALLIGGAVPALAEKPDWAGEGRGPSAGEETDRRGPPDDAKAYGWRIKDAYGLPFGLLLQCNPDFVPDEVSEGYEAFGVTCENVLDFEDADDKGTSWELGASVFWTTNKGIIFAI
ncbi:MAG: hypothetical protein QGM47_02065 [Actinomycetota bacterium]|nr:hypothetical protein [Actinomycetota bacterium]